MEMTKGLKSSDFRPFFMDSHHRITMSWLEKSGFLWWGGLDWRLRMTIALLVIGFSTVLLIAGIPWGGVGLVIGTIMLLFSFPNKAEKKGYQDY